MTHLNHQQGFSTVELLISLFIAAAFISTGFQLFSAVTKDSNEARLRSKAASLANDYLQKNTSLAPVPCEVRSQTTNASIPTADLPQATYDVNFLCPYGTTAKTTRTVVTVKYGNPQETVQAVLDVTR